MNLLYLSSWFPFPPTNGSELRINALIRGLAARHDVTLLSFQRRPIDPRGLAQARAILSDVRLVPWREFAPDSRRARLGFLSSQPRSVVDTYSTEMDMLIREVIAMHQYDAVVVSQLAMAAYWPAWGDLPTVLDEVELGSSREQSRLASTPMARVRRASCGQSCNPMCVGYCPISMPSPSSPNGSAICYDRLRGTIQPSRLSRTESIRPLRECSRRP